MKNRFQKILLATLLVALVVPTLGAQEPVDDGKVALDAQVRPLAVEAAKIYRDQARYPEHSKALSAGALDPIRDERKSHPITVRDRQKADRSLTVWSEQLAYEVGEPVVLYAQLQGIRASAVTGELRTSDGRAVARVTFYDDGVAPDVAAGDGLLTAGLELADRVATPELADSYLVQIDAATKTGDPLTAVTGFLLTNPGARLTGDFRSSVVDGNLVVEGRVDVERAGRFHLSGVLHTRSGEPIGTAQAAAVLEPGQHWMALDFYGLMFHDRGVQGPFQLGSVTLTATGSMPNALGPVLENVHLTRPHKATAFTAEPFGNPDLLEAAARLEALERARTEK